MKTARRKLEIPMRSSRETCRTIGGRKTKYACIVEADEYMRIRMEGAPLRYHEEQYFLSNDLQHLK